MNAVGRAGIDRDAIARGSPDGRDHDAAVDGPDRLGDGHRATAARIEHVDLAAGGGLGERERKSPAWRGIRAGSAVGSLSGNKRPVWSRLRGRGGKAAGEK